MLSANKEKLNSFFSGSSQYHIPYFQRSYVWNIDNWGQLWENLTEELEAYQKEKDSEHFIGTIIVKQKRSERLGALEYELVDGQQRLTTTCLLLRAIQDFTTDKELKIYINSLLSFKDSHGKKNIRLVHSKVDREYFQNILLNDNNQDLLTEFSNDSSLDRFNNIQGAYLFFINSFKNDLQQTELRDLLDVVLNKLPVIHMALSKNDDVQQIFDTINSLGVKLTTAELLKNHLFAFAEVKDLYEEYWQDIFEIDEDTVNFWSSERTAGRNRRSTVELFLYSYLVIKTTSSIRIDSLFKEFKVYIKKLNKIEKVEFVKDLSDYAKIYAQFPNGENISQISFVEDEKRFMHILRELDISTVFPLVIFIYKEVGDIEERKKIIKFLESYLVRRTICRLTTKNYNNLFISIIRDLKNRDTISLETVKEKILSYNDDSSKFPDNETLQHSISHKYLVNKFSREILYCISLYHLNHRFQDNSKLSFDGLSVEHIMPKKWRNNWSFPVDFTEQERDYKLLTLGNLTLIQGRLNSSLRDNAWIDKKNSLQDFSTLKITTDYLSVPDWEETSIDKRAENLFEDIKTIWSEY